MRQGNPATIDVVFGTVLVVVLLEAFVVPLVLLCRSYLYFYSLRRIWHAYAVSNLKHPGVSWDLFINSMYFPEEGIFGVTLWIVSTVVFHFVLFGILAQRMGLGQFFVDVATVAAGRYTGGLAKVSVVSSAFLNNLRIINC